MIIGAGLWYRQPLTATLFRIETEVAELQFWGPILVTLLAAIWAILCFPGPIMLSFIGTVYSKDPHLGVAVAVVADGISESVGFLVARRLGRERVVKWLGDKPWFEWLEKQIEQRGAYGVFAIRMMPFFPNSLATYAFGLTSLRFWPYIIASVLGSIPNLALYVGGTAGIVHLVRYGLGTEISMYTAGGVLVVTVILLMSLQAVLRRYGVLPLKSR
ncbi:MAG: VTT domain-containing protein [Vulcanimicrobiota bacterium]